MCGVVAMFFGVHNSLLFVVIFYKKSNKTEYQSKPFNSNTHHVTIPYAGNVMDGWMDGWMDGKYCAC
jgi:hypothetical protein